MLQTRAVIWMLMLAATLDCARATWSQDYPGKPLRIVTSGAGGSSDLTARLIAQGITGALGQQVIVDNRPSGVIPGQVVSQAPPDGYTVLLGGNSLWVSPLLQKTPYDVVRDFSPVTTTSRTPHIVVVPGLPTVAASGLPGYDFVPVDGIFAPAKTPAAIINRLNQEIVRFLNAAETKERFLNSASEAIGSTPEAFSATIKAEIARMGLLVKDANIRAE